MLNSNFPNHQTRSGSYFDNIPDPHTEIGFGSKSYLYIYPTSLYLRRNRMEVFNKQIYLVRRLRTPLVYMIMSTSIYHNPVPVVQSCDPYWFQRGSGNGSGCKIFCQCGSGYGSGCRVLMTKNWKKFTTEHFLTFFLSKIAIYLSLSLHEGRPSYRRSLHPLKSEHLAFQT
jgi:hypothetical protein